MLLTMVTHDTEENNRAWMTKAALESLSRTVDWNKHRLVVVDNASCEETTGMLQRARDNGAFDVILNAENLGTAKAINLAWKRRLSGEHAIKMDNDVVIKRAGWVDDMEEVFSRYPDLGILGLKRNDLAQAPWELGDMQSSLRMVPHVKGESWHVVEEVKDVIGTCVAHSSDLLDKIGFLKQPGVYGFDDALTCVRAKVAGFKAGFLIGVEIDHIDPGGDTYCEWKREQATLGFPAFNTMAALYQSGIEEVYYNGE